MSEFRVCPECGSPDIHYAAWVHVNTGEILNEEPPAIDYYCARCREYFRKATTEEMPEFVVMLGSETTSIDATSALRAAQEMAESRFDELFNTIEVSVRQVSMDKLFKEQVIKLRAVFVRAAERGE